MSYSLSTPQKQIDPEWLKPISPNRNMVELDDAPSGMPCLLSFLVMGVSSCLCVTLLMLASVLGYNDELQAIQTDTGETVVADLNKQYVLSECDRVTGFDTFAALRVTSISATQAAYFDNGDAPTFRLSADQQAYVAEINQQYNQARLEVSQGDFTSALERYVWIATAIPGCTDASQRIENMQRFLSATPTETPALLATPTDVIVETLPAETPTVNLDVTASPTLPTEEFVFKEAQREYDFGRSEPAVEYLEILKASYPSYQRNEVDMMLFNSLTRLATIYLRGQNGDNDSGVLPGNQLSRGIILARRADQIRQANPSVGAMPNGLLYEAGFAERYLQAEALLTAGNYAAAANLFEILISESPNWGYRGRTLQVALSEARGGS